MSVNIEPVVVKTESWLKTHERIVLTFMVLFVILWLGNKYVDHSAAVAGRQLAIAQDTLAQTKQQTQEFKQTANDALSQYKQLVDSLQKQNLALQNQQVQRNQNLQKQQELNQTLPLSDLSLRWNSLLNLNAGDLQVLDSKITVSDSAARTTVNALEQVPVLQQNLKDQQTQTENANKETASCNTVNTNLEKYISGLQAEKSAEQNACVAQINQVKAEGRKNSVKWFKRGFILGFIGGLFGGHAVGF